MGSQSGYFCVSLHAAAMFIENLKSEQLAIDPDYFRNHLLENPVPLEGTDHINSPAPVTSIPEPVIESEQSDLLDYLALASARTVSEDNTASQPISSRVVSTERFPADRPPIFQVYSVLTCYFRLHSL